MIFLSNSDIKCKLTDLYGKDIAESVTLIENMYCFAFIGITDDGRAIYSMSAMITRYALGNCLDFGVARDRMVTNVIPTMKAALGEKCPVFCDLPLID